MQKALRNQIEQLEPGLTIIVSKPVEPEKLLEVVSAVAQCAAPQD